MMNTIDLLRNKIWPERFIKKVRQSDYNPNTLYNKRIFEREYGSGIDIMKQDWDNLIILDACRFDIFKQVCDVKGELKYVISKGSHSHEFCKKNFYGEEYHDTIYITANPYGARICTDVFFKTILTFNQTKMEHSDRITETKGDNGHRLHPNNYENVDPEKLKEYTIDTHKRYPNKRLITHFMQPHAPYIGNKAAKLRSRIKDNHGLIFKYWENLDNIEDKNSVNSLMSAAMEGYISEEQLLEVYIENIEIVMEYVYKIINEVNGKTIVTSDHGELLGEKYQGRQFGHRDKIYTEELRKVPWLEIESGQRRTISAGMSKESSIDDERIDEQLEALGYK